jgi:hypothetical protein
LKANVNTKKATPSKKGSSSKVSSSGANPCNAETVGSGFRGKNGAPGEGRGAKSIGHDLSSNISPACIEPVLHLPTFLKWNGAAKVRCHSHDVWKFVELNTQPPSVYAL